MTTHLPVAFFQIRGLAQSREAAKKTNFRVADHPGAIPPTYPKNGAFIENSRGAAAHS